MEDLLGGAIPALERSMRFRAARQGVLAANLANVDTPGYRRVDVHFEGALDRASAQLRRTHPSHRSGRVLSTHRVEVEPPSHRPDRNGVTLERELITASRNSGAFTQHADVMSRLISIQRMAIVGEPR